MDLEYEDGKVKVFSDGDNKKYTMTNMGSYVGHKDREWYAPVPEVWILTSYDEKLDNGEILHMEAQVDDVGHYISFFIDKGDKRRVIQMKHEMVYKDVITKRPNSIGDLGGTRFVALDVDLYSESDVSLEDYLTCQPTFSSEGETYNGELSDNNLIAEFVRKNEELKARLNSNQK